MAFAETSVGPLHRLRRSPSPFRGGLEIQQQQQLGVHAESLGTLLLDEVGNVGARDEVDIDVLVLVAAALADLSDTMRTDDRESLGQHAGRGIEFTQPLDPIGAEPRLLLKLLDRRRFNGRVGIVVSDKPDKTIIVRIDITRRHPTYEKIVRRSRTLHAHDERNEAGEGDTVRVVETRPLSRSKRWRLVEVIEKAR